MSTLNPNRPILVTGASGFLGEHLTRYLLKKRRYVIGVQFSHFFEIFGSPTIVVDLRDPSAVSRMIRDIHPCAVFHCAAITDVAFCEREPESARAGILEATTNLVDAIQEHSPDTRLVSVSTDLVFDGQNPPYAETDEAKPLSIYGGLKYQAEAPVLKYEKGFVVRSALMYGSPTTHKGSFLAWMVRAFMRGELLQLFTDEIRTPVYVEDLYRAMIFLAETGEPGLYHAGGPESLTRFEMGRQACRVFGFNERLLVARTLSESKYVALRPPDVSLNSARLWQRCGFAPKSFREGLKHIAAH